MSWEKELINFLRFYLTSYSKIQRSATWSATAHPFNKCNMTYLYPFIYAEIVVHKVYAAQTRCIRRNPVDSLNIPQPLLQPVSIPQRKSVSITRKQQTIWGELCLIFHAYLFIFLVCESTVKGALTWKIVELTLWSVCLYSRSLSMTSLSILILTKLGNLEGCMYT